MSTHNQYPQLVKVFLAVCLMISFSACADQPIEEIIPLQQDSPISSFPDEITPENWKLFIHAPLKLIEQLREKEIANNPRIIHPEINDKEGAILGKTERVYLIKGAVKAFDGNWRDIANVQIESDGNISSSFQNLGNRSYNYFFGVANPAPICMSYPTEQGNGLSLLDLVIIKKHMSGSNPFTYAREYLAADVNRDGLINDVDVFHIESLLLERETELPDTDNVIFVSEDQLSSAQALVDAGNFDDASLRELGRTPACQDAAPDRFLIKSGDVNGTAVF
ncbi:MAG: hypothetical protein AAFR87_35450 [Bacteroidota bacterium]